MNEEFKLDFYTQYRQFYIADKKSPVYDSNKFWTEEQLNNRLASAQGVLGVGTECYGQVKAEIVFNPNKLKTDFSEYDHVVEGDLKIQSGTIYILDCPNCAVEFERSIDPGNYRVRISSSNLDSVVDDDGEDFYRIEIWKDNEGGTTLYKKYSRV